MTKNEIFCNFQLSFGYGTDMYAFVCYAIRHKVTGVLENRLMYTWGMFQIDIF